MAGKIEGLSIELDLDSVKVDRGLKGLKDNLRTVNSEMKSNMSAFDRSDRSIGKYETRLGGLNKKLELQKRVTAEAKTEYEKMVREHGEGSKEAEKAAREYNNQAASLNNLERYVQGATEELERLKREQRIANSNFTKIGKTLDKTGDKFQSFGRGMDKVGKAWTKGVTLPLLGIATAAVASAKKTGEHAEKVVFASQKAGLAEESYQELSYALKQLGLEQADVDRALGRLNQRMGRAQQGNEKYGKALKAVGISQKDLEKGTYDTDEAFIKIIKSLQKVESSQERSAKASEIFGTNMSRKLMPAINGGAEELEELRKKANETGAVMSGKALKDSIKFKEAMDDLKERGAGLVHELGAKLAPTFTDKLIPVIENKGIPMLESMTDKVIELIEWYTDLDDGTKKWINRLGLLAVAGGPVLSLTGKLTTGFGGLLKGVGRVSKSIGVMSGTGLAASLGGLGPLAIGGIAVAGLAAVGTAAYKLYKNTKKSEEANLDLTESLVDEADALESATETFDKLSDKAKISNTELSVMNDLNKKISESTNPGAIAELKERYNELAEKSGLSKKEIKRLFKANDDIIDQAPDVQTSISDTGNKFVKSSEKVQEYIDALREASMEELDAQLDVALENRDKALGNIKSKQEDINNLKEKLTVYTEAHKLSEDEVAERLDEISGLYNDQNLSHEKKQELVKEETALMDIQDGKYAEAIDDIQEQIDKKRESIGNSEEEIEKYDALKQQASDLILKQAGINKEGNEGLEQLDKKIIKEQELFDELDKKRKNTGQLTDEEQEQYELLAGKIEKHKDARDKIFEELGLYSDLNDAVDTQIDNLDYVDKQNMERLLKGRDINTEEGNIIQQMKDQNTELDDQIGKLVESKKQEGANKDEINNQVDSLKAKKVQNLRVQAQLLEELGFSEDIVQSLRDQANNIDTKTSKTKETKFNEELLGNQVDITNQNTLEGIGLEENRTKEAGKDANKNIYTKQHGLEAIDRMASKKKTKEVGLFQTGLAKINREASKPISKTVNFRTAGLSTIHNALSRYADGTSGHSGGHAIMGDGKGNNAGSELVNLPSGKSFFSADKPTLYPNLPKGTEVISAKNTRKLLGNIKHYASGTATDFMRLLAINGKSEEPVTINGRSGDNRGIKELLNATLQQNEILMKLLAKDNDILIGDDEIKRLGKKSEPTVTAQQNRKTSRKRRGPRFA